jgi:5-methylcytosine-specific restriction endonuclease McrA
MTIIASDVEDEYAGGLRSVQDALGSSILHGFDVYCRKEDRDPSLSGLPYDDYLKSEHWRETRERKLLRSGYRCQGYRGFHVKCVAEGVQLDVHHLTYARLGRELESDLIVLCHDCHGKAHGRTRP